MSEPITLPPIPPAIGPESTPAEVDLYLRIVGFYMQRETREAIDAQTAQMALMTAAATRSGDLMQQFLDQTPPAPTAGSDGARVAMTALLSESTDRPPAEVATAVLARVAAVDSMLGGEPQP